MTEDQKIEENLTKTDQDFITNPEKYFRKSVIFASTDGYGICLGVAFERYLKEKGIETELRIDFPRNSPRFFWTGESPTALQETSDFETAFVFGIPLNSWSPDTLQTSLETANSLAVGMSPGSIEPQPKLVLANQRHNREDLPPCDFPDKVRDLTVLIEKTLEENLAGGEVNLVTLARFIIKDSSVLAEIIDSEQIKKYETLALGVEVASRATFAWHEGNEGKLKGQDFLDTQAKESNKRIKETVERLKKRDWDYFNREAKEFRQQMELPTITLPPVSSSDGRPTLAFVDVGNLPIGFHFLALEEIAARTEARWVVATRHNPLVSRDLEEKPTESPYRVKLVENWKGANLVGGQLEKIKKYLLEQDQLVGSQRFLTIQVSEAKRLAELTKDLLLSFDQELNQVFESANTIAILGDPQVGKSTSAEMIERYCNLLAGKEVAKRQDWVDLYGITPDSYLDAVAEMAEIERLAEAGVAVDQNLVDKTKARLVSETISRERQKTINWSEQDLVQIRKRIDGLPEDQINLIDMPGGSWEKNSQGEVVGVKRNDVATKMFLGSPVIDGVFILGRNLEEIEGWRQVVEQINQERASEGFCQLVVIGDAIVSTEKEKIERADYPQRVGREVVGRVTGIRRENLYLFNNTYFMMAILIVSLGLKEKI